VKGWLAEHPGALLVFDDLDDLELVKPYWPTEDPKPFVLATSRRRELSELQRMHRLELDVWMPSEALAFLRKRTERSRPDDADEAAAAQLAAEVGYLPLALEQAGAYLAADKATSFAEYRDTYARARLKLLENQKPVAGDYQRSVATTWKVSMERAPAAARELLAALSHLSPNGIPFELVTCAPDALGAVTAGDLPFPAYSREASTLAIMLVLPGG
jgi:hypothetical protein